MGEKEVIVLKIGLIDVDGHHFPNLCLMKLSAWHKAQRDIVEWWSETAENYDIVYMAKVFSDAYSPDFPTPTNAVKVIRGGTGYAIWLEGDKEVYHKAYDPPLAIVFRFEFSAKITVSKFSQYAKVPLSNTSTPAGIFMDFNAWQL